MTKKDFKAWQETIVETVNKLDELMSLQADADSYDELSEKQQESPKGQLLLQIQDLDLQTMIDSLNELDGAIDDLLNT